MKSRLITGMIAGMLLFVAVTETSAAIHPVDAPITAVTVYPRSAGITRTAEIYLEAGEQSLTIKDLPLAAMEESFRASLSGGNGVTMLGLKHWTEQHLESPQVQVAELDKQIRLLETERKQSIADRIESFTQQKKLLTAITEGSSSQMSEQLVKGGLDVSQWGEVYQFIGKGVRETNDSIRVANRELHEVDQQLEKLKAELATIDSSGTKSTRTVQIDLRLSQPTTLKVSLYYAITGASWRPLYDARLIDDNHVDMTYLAEVAQMTGEDWKDVDLTLSTSSSSGGTGPGELRWMQLSLFSAVKVSSNTVDDLLKEVARVQTTYTGDVFIRGGRAGEVSYIVETAQTVASAYSVTFRVGRKETVRSGAEAIRTTIAQWRLNAKTNLLCRPRNREAVYRMVTVTNQAEAPLMPGKVAIFAETDFLGNAQIEKYIAPNQEFELPFGADKNLEVNREQLAYKEGEKSGMLSHKKRIEKTIKITLTNHSASARTIKIEEPTPVAMYDDIKVKLDDPSPKPLEIDEHGIATWTITLQPRAEQVILVPYRVDYPAGSDLAGM